MFSVNIDKIVGMTDNEKKCYEELRENLKKELNGGKVLAITKNGIGAFKIAYSFVCAGEKVLFIDADIMSEIFLGKYKLGKNLKGVADFLKKPSQMYDLICKTNNPQFDIIFTGVLDDGVISEDEESMMKQFIDMYSDKYDRIVLSSDVDGRIAKYCDGTVIMYEESEFGELSAENYVDELENNKCDNKSAHNCRLLSSRFRKYSSVYRTGKHSPPPRWQPSDPCCGSEWFRSDGSLADVLPVLG